MNLKHMDKKEATEKKRMEMDSLSSKVLKLGQKRIKDIDRMARPGRKGGLRIRLSLESWR